MEDSADKSLEIITCPAFIRKSLAGKVLIGRCLLTGQDFYNSAFKCYAVLEESGLYRSQCGEFYFNKNLEVV